MSPPPAQPHCFPLLPMRRQQGKLIGKACEKNNHLRSCFAPWIRNLDDLGDLPCDVLTELYCCASLPTGSARTASLPSACQCRCLVSMLSKWMEITAKLDRRHSSRLDARWLPMRTSRRQRRRMPISDHVTGVSFDLEYKGVDI